MRATAGAVAWRFRYVESRVPPANAVGGAATAGAVAWRFRYVESRVPPACGLSCSPSSSGSWAGRRTRPTSSSPAASPAPSTRSGITPSSTSSGVSCARTRPSRIRTRTSLPICGARCTGWSRTDRAQRRSPGSWSRATGTSCLSPAVAERHGAAVGRTLPARRGGLIVLAVHLRRRRRTPSTPIDEDARERLQRIIEARD